MGQAGPARRRRSPRQEQPAFQQAGANIEAHEGMLVWLKGAYDCVKAFSEPAGEQHHSRGVQNDQSRSGTRTGNP